MSIANVHKFKMHGVNIVVDVNSGLVYVAHDIFADILSCMELSFDSRTIVEALGQKYPKSHVETALAEVNELIEHNKLFSNDVYEEYLPRLQEGRVVKALCLLVTNHCNLKCRYCFADKGSYGQRLMMMDLATAKEAVDLVIASSGQRRNIEIDFFGGEPLLNFKVVRKVIEYAKKQQKIHNKNFRFTITTNGILLSDEIMNYVNENMHNVVLSIDGTPSTNDSMRLCADGSGSYRKIIDKFLKLAQLREQSNYYVRGTFTKNNLNFSKDVLHLADVGFRQISIEPVVSAPSNEFAITEAAIPQIFAEYEKLVLEYVNRKKTIHKSFNFFHFMVDLDYGPCIIKRMCGCGAGCEYLAITPDGKIYPCHQFAGNSKYVMGDVFNKNISKKIADEFSNCNIYTKTACQSCFAKFHCSGGCHANAFNYENNIHIPHKISCALIKKRLECALYVQSQKSNFAL